MTIRLLAGDARDILPTLPADSVHCVVTSPPYFGLRDYGTAQWDGGDAQCDHARASTKVGNATTLRRDGREHLGLYDGEKATEPGYPFRDTCGKCGARRVDRQIGLEATPDEYLATMVAVFRAIRRVMRPDAVAFVNMGDGYRDKQLLLMPARLALALQQDGWWVRSDIIWHKPNPMPESCTDRPTSAHEHVFLLTKRATYFFDNDAIREPQSEGTIERFGNGNAPRRPAVKQGGTERQCDTWRDPVGVLPAGRSCRNVWTIATHAYSAAHFATFPAELASRCIRAGTSERGCCSTCGAPWRRVVERTPASVLSPGSDYGNGAGRHDGGRSQLVGAGATTTGWAASCDHRTAVVPCTVLDPFFGAGTTGLVADRLGRDCVGIDLNPDYNAMSRARIEADAPLFAQFPVADPADERLAMTDLFAPLAAD